MLRPLLDQFSFRILFSTLSENLERIPIERRPEAHLFNEYRGFVLPCDGNERLGPFQSKWTSAGTRLTSDNDPVNSGEIDLSQVFEERLDGEEAEAHRSIAQSIDAWDSVFAILDTDSPQNM